MSPATIGASELSKQNPWPGLRAFGENDVDFFFGRDREGAELFSLVQRSPVVVLYGQSGLGKTSLLQAGLFPRLKAVDFFPVRVRFDHGEDAPPLAQQITAAVAEELDRLQIKGPRPKPNDTLWEYFHRKDVDFWGPRNRLLTPVVVLDQFEEIFTLGHRSEKSNARVAVFQRELESQLEHRPPDSVRERFDVNPDEALQYDLKRQGVKFVITLREDFLADLDPWRERMPSLLPNRFRLERMTGQQALEVVQRAGSDVVDPSVARDIVDFVSTSRLKRSSSALEQRDVDPALLSVVCDGLNYSRISRGKPRITADLLTAEREEIMKDFYERTFEGVDPRVRDWIEDRLLTSAGYRDRAALDDAKKLGLPEADFDVLVNRRLLHREERAGVIWLELTHDSLTDPSSRSRAVREQRIQAEAAKEREKAAAEREAQVRRQLRKSQLLVASFGVLAVIALFAFYVSFRYYRQAKANELVAQTNEQRLEAEHKTMMEQKSRADAKESELSTVRENNEENFKKQVAAAGSLFDMRVPTATVTNIIQITDNSFITLSSEHTSQNDIDLPHARFLAQAAEALYQVGHYDEGLKYADRAMALITGNVKPGDSQNNLPAIRAEALYARGVGLLAQGSLKDARQCFDEALKLASTNPDPEEKQALARVFVLSHIGIGEIEADSYRYPEARQHYESAIKFVKQSGSTADEYLYWQVLALKGQWLTENDDVKAQPYIAQANDLVSRLLTHDPGNIRWKTLSTDINYSQGFTDLRLTEYDAAKSLFEQAEATAEDLYRRDSENREWHLNVARLQRALGLTHYDQGELPAGEKYLTQSAEAAKELNTQQPSWTRAAQLRGLVMLSVGDIKVSRHSDSPDATNDLNAVFEIYTQALKLFQERAAAAPSVLFFADDVSQGFGRQGFLRSVQGDEARAKDTKDQQAQDLMKQRYGEALGFYAQAFQALEPLVSIAKNDPSITQERADIYQRIGSIEHNLKDSPKAIAAFQNSIAGTIALVKLAPTAENYGRLDVALSSLGDTYEESGDTEKALAQYNSAVDALNKAQALRPDDTELTRKRAVVQSRISDVWFARGNLENALNELEKAFDSVWKALQYDYSGATLNSNLKFYQDRLARIRKGVTDKPAAGSQQTALTPEASTALLHRIDDLAARTNATNLLDRNQKNASWALRTMMLGDWRILTGSEMTSALAHLLEVNKGLTSDQVRGIRKTHLDFYDDSTLYEADVKGSAGRDGVVTFIQRGNEWTVLNGDKQVIYHMNAIAAPKLDQPDLALEYLRFFVNSVEAVDQGRFRLIEHAEDIDWLPSASGETRSSTASKIKPLLLESTSDKEWQAIGTLQLGDDIWEAGFHLARSGDVSIQESRNIERGSPIYLDSFSNGIRVRVTMAQMNAGKPQRDLAGAQSALKANPKDETALKQLPIAYFTLKQWKDAVEAQKNWVALVKSKPDSVATKTIDLRDAYTVLAWYQLFVRDFDGAIASSQEATKLDPSQLMSEEDRGFALMLAGRTKEAETLFLSNGGKKMSPSSTQLWDDVIMGDYAALSKEGITSPDADRIGNLISRQEDSRNMAQDEQTLKTNSTDEKSLRQLPYLYYKARRWADAVEAEKRTAAFFRSKPDSDATKATSLRDILNALAWYQLFARDYAGSLASTDEARKLDPDNLYTESERAYALMLLGRDREAEEIYVGNIGRKMPGNGDQLWEAAILTDFTSLENQGVTNRELARVRALLQRPEYERVLAQYLQDLKKNPNDDAALRYLPGAYYNLQRWGDAAEAEKNRVAYLKKQTNHDTNWTNLLDTAEGSLSWYQLLSRDFAGALASSDDAMKLNPNDLAATMNHAHAMLFLGRTQEAEAIYAANVGKKMDSNQLWDESVLDDFNSLEKAGITSPDLPRMRTLMQRAAYERQLALYQQKLKANPNDEDALSQIADVYAHLGRAQDAVDAGKAFIAFIQRQTNHDANWTRALSGAYVQLAFHQLFTRDFKGALESSDEALKLIPNSLVAETNRAHALLFLGRIKEAEAIYLQYRGQKVFANSDQKWDEAITTDFDDLEKAGITHPDFAHLRQLLKPQAN